MAIKTRLASLAGVLEKVRADLGFRRVHATMEKSVYPLYDDDDASIGGTTD